MDTLTLRSYRRACEMIAAGRRDHAAESIFTARQPYPSAQCVRVPYRDLLDLIELAAPYVPGLRTPASDLLEDR